MVKLFLVLGLALLAGGAYAIVDGWPYRVLERGFTEVILGALDAALPDDWAVDHRPSSYFSNLKREEFFKWHSSVSPWEVDAYLTAF